MENVIIESRRFGRIETPSSNLIEFESLPGFPSAHRFVLLQHDRESPFGWLVCADEPELAFVVTDPRNFFPDYSPELPAALTRPEGSEPFADLAVLAIADIHSGEVHLNLAAPLVVDLDRRRAAQVILEGVDYPVRKRIDASGGEGASG